MGDGSGEGKGHSTSCGAAQQVLDKLFSDLFDRPIISNMYRAEYVERLIVHFLGDQYRQVGADWSGWDIEREDGLRIEVKQSAARQTWSERPGHTGKPTKPIYDIAPRTGYWKEGGAIWHDEPGRPAHIYIFAWHPRYSPIGSVDHRDPAQWEFYLVPTAELPKGKTLSGRKIFKQWECVAATQLRETIDGYPLGS